MSASAGGRRVSHSRVDHVFEAMLTNIGVSRVLVDARCRLADARVLDVSHLGVGRGVLADRVRDAVVGGAVALVQLRDGSLAAGGEGEQGNCRSHAA